MYIYFICITLKIGFLYGLLPLPYPTFSIMIFSGSCSPVYNAATIAAPVGVIISPSLFVILIGIFMTLFITKLLSKTLLKGKPATFTLELPPYRKPQFGSIIVRSILDRTLFVLGRAVVIAAPAGLVIWLLANLTVDNISILSHVSNFLNPFAKIICLDGVILIAFISPN